MRRCPPQSFLLKVDMMNTASSFAPEEHPPLLYVGEHESQRSAPVDLTLLSQAHELGYDFLTTPITNSAFHSRVLALLEDRKAKMPPIVPPLTLGDTTLEPKGSDASLVASISPWIDLASPDPLIASVSRQILNLEVAYAAFCGITNIILHGPTATAETVQFARAIREALGLGPFIHLHILLPVTGELDQDIGDYTHLSELASDSTYAEETNGHDQPGLHASWDTWNTIRTLCNYSQKLSIALEIPRQLSSLDLQSRWFAEPVRVLVLPNTSFLRNAKGYPVLSRQHQTLLSRFARLRYSPSILLSDVGYIQNSNVPVESGKSPEPTPAEAASQAKEKPKDPVPHLRYLRHLQQNQPVRPPMERFGQGYQDYLQSPLQPLTDNLESITYEVFEKDPIKYEWYKRAIAAALKDLAAVIQESRALNVAIVGAGRGPLVTRALQAAKETGIAVQCWAVEKNPNAFVLLQRMNVDDPLWDGQVNLVKSDMRHWQGPVISGSLEKVDILVSELLGSFADNELSPECLDGVQNVLNPAHGVSIPQSYSAHLTPISTPRLHSDLLIRAGAEKWELPYVVMLHQHDYLCTQTGSDIGLPEVKHAWSFSHPTSSDVLERSLRRAGGQTDVGGWAGGDGWNEHNTRSCRVHFESKQPGVCHGLAGYFETVLYESASEKVELSTNPVTMDEKSKDMISWFPIFFPIQTPLFIPENSDIEVSMWRQTDDRTVWYEWVVEVFENVKGRKRRLAISDFHSSRKNGCLT